MQFCAELAGEPHNKSEADLLDMTRWWAVQVVRHPRDKEGGILLPPRFEEAPDLEKLFRDSYRKKGWPEHAVDHAWQLRKTRHPGRRTDDGRQRVGVGEVLARGRPKPPPTPDPLEED